MKYTIAVFGLCLFMLVPALWAIPTEINYQGTLKEHGLPVNTSATNVKTIQYTLTSQDGKTAYSNTITDTPQIVNGLFSSKLDFQLLPGRTWENIAPYIKVNVNGQDLTPPEKLSATVYAKVSNDIVDGAITPAKITAGFGLVPAGAIVLSTSTCPIGWVRFSDLDNTFPMGGATFGSTGGSATHKHVIVTDGAHNHGGATGGANRGSPHVVGTPLGAPSGEYIEDVANQPQERSSAHSHLIGSDGNHNHGGFTEESSTLPPFKTVIFCQKLPE